MTVSYTHKFSLLKSLSTVANIPISIVTKENLLTRYPDTSQTNPMFTSFLEHLHHFRILKNEIQLITTDFFENFLSIPLDNFWLVLGPVVYQHPTRSKLRNSINSFSKKKDINDLEEYLLSQPFIHINQLIEAGNLAYLILTGKNTNILKEINDLTMEYYSEVITRQTEYIYNVRTNSLFHHDPILERRIYQLVEEGNVEEIIPYYKAFMARGDFKLGVLSKKSNLRSLKNITIATITLATRAAIRGGVHPEDAYTKGDIMIQELEVLDTVDKVNWFREQILFEFTNMVAKTKRRKYSKKVTLCQELIYKHLYDPDLSLTFIANKLQLNKKYLSNLFKKEVGISINQFIHQQKINEAKKLLVYFNRSISEVSNDLNFTDQSHFTRVFKQYTHKTPKQFIDESKIDSFI